ncbi:MAG: HTH-type transcriptional repressor CsiR [Microbacteriaceae bacterium]|nr:HTH-type transcriptional repressor CsiR [Microbacteriaceae bacterium]
MILDPQRNRGRLSGQVYEAVKTRLLDGEYAAGAKLSVEAIRTEFGVSKQPVMEALRLLAADGLVEILPQVGCVVMRYSLQEVDDFFEIFAAFEGAIAGAAAERRTDADLGVLEAASRRIERISAKPDPRARSSEYRLENRAFHEGVHRIVNSRIMTDASRRMWDLSDLLINTTGRMLPLSYVTGERHAEHEGILAAIRAGDAPSARSLMEEHIRATPRLVRESESPLNPLDSPPNDELLLPGDGV